MLKKIVYAMFLTVVFYAIILISIKCGLHSYPSTTFQFIGPIATFLLLFGTVNNVLQGMEKK